MADKKIEELLARNKEYSKTYKVPLSVTQQRASGPPAYPAIAILCCVDARLWPEDFFQLTKGEAVVVRNAGGRAMDAMRSLLVLDAVIALGTIIVIHHTDCGMTHVTDNGIRKDLKAIAPEHAHEIDEMKFGEIKSIPDSVQEDMAILKASPYFKNEVKMLGYIFDLEKGTLAEVAQK